MCVSIHLGTNNKCENRQAVAFKNKTQWQRWNNFFRFMRSLIALIFCFFPRILFHGPFVHCYSSAGRIRNRLSLKARQFFIRSYGWRILFLRVIRLKRLISCNKGGLALKQKKLGFAPIWLDNNIHGQSYWSRTLSYFKGKLTLFFRERHTNDRT